MPSWTIVEIQHLTKRFGQFAAVEEVSLEIRRGEFFSLLGPSGCGKTTLLRMIAGLELPDQGSIIINGREMTHAPAHRRPVNMVFQHYALFPHLTVAQNIAFGLRYKGVARSEFAGRVDRSLALVRLEGLNNRYPNQLSGGQRQRVALARALVLEPAVLLLDEPLGALDQKLRKEMQVELKNLQRQLGLTFIFVTHDQEEALTMSDRIAVMNHGKIEQLDAAAEVFERPRTEFVANFMGASNFFAGHVRGVGEELISIRSPAGFEIQLKSDGKPHRRNDPIRFIVRPEKLDLRAEIPGGENIVYMEAMIEQRIYQGINTVWTVSNNQNERFSIYEQNTRPPEQMHQLSHGTKAYVCWNPRHAVILS